MVSEARKQSMAWMETDYSKHTHFRWKIKWRLEHFGALGIMGETALFTSYCSTNKTKNLLYLSSAGTWPVGEDLSEMPLCVVLERTS